MLGQYENGKVYDVDEDSIEDIVEYMVDASAEYKSNGGEVST